MPYLSGKARSDKSCHHDQRARIHHGFQTEATPQDTDERTSNVGQCRRECADNSKLCDPCIFEFRQLVIMLTVKKSSDQFSRCMYGFLLTCCMTEYEKGIPHTMPSMQNPETSTR